MTTLRRAAFAFLLFLALPACQPVSESLGTASASLSEAQCNYFQEGGEVTICHGTSSAKNPMVKIRVALQGCVDAHSNHAGDSIAVNDDCGPSACLAEGAPCDSTLRCCGGACAADGVCPPADLCEGVICAALDQCHYAGVCDPTSGLCSNQLKPDGTSCDDSNPCSDGDQCSAGVCAGALCNNPAAPVCGPGGCVECVSSDDCPPSRPLCASAACVQCLDALDCPATDPVCGADNLCGPCSTDAQCGAFGSFYVCDVTSGPGIPGDCVGCVMDSDCPPHAPTCINRMCT